MGGNISSWARTITDPPGINPGPDATPTFDPMFGFSEGRKERGIKAYYYSSIICLLNQLEFTF